MMLPLHLFIGLCTTLLMLTPLASAQSNDTFATPTELTGLPLPLNSFNGSTATAEPSEPPHAGSPAAASIWFRWTAPASGLHAFGEWLHPGSARIAIYTGDTLKNLVLVAQGLDRVAFIAAKGDTYRIALDTPGPDSFYLRTYPVGGADELADADEITFKSDPVAIAGNNVLATTSSLDGNFRSIYPPTRTVWWKWTATFSGPVRIDNRRCQFYPLMDVFTTDSSGVLTQETAGFKAVGWVATEGTTYCIRLDDTAGLGGEINLWMERFPAGAPPNDMIAKATNLGSVPIACAGAWLYLATSEAGLPHENVGMPSSGVPGDSTVWWKWTCPSSGFHRVSTYGSDGYTQVYIYTGTPSSLSPLGASIEPNGARFSANAGTTYWVKVLTYSNRCIRAEINIHPATTESTYFQNLDVKAFFRLAGEQRLPDADPDGDGLPNLVELACGTHLERADAANPSAPRIVFSSAGPRLRWTTASVSGLNIELTGQVAIHPAGPWSSPPSFTESTYDYSVPLPSGTCAFGRLKAHDPSLSSP
jgi:hypothetical protein